MMVEFVGLPGCGKSTLASHLERRLTLEGYHAQGLRNAAKSVMEGAQDKIGFLRQRGERISLYGCMVYAEANPELFEWVFRTSRARFAELIWNMEALSQMGIVGRHGPADMIVLNEEGLVQRFAGTFLDAAHAPELDEVNALLPGDFLTIYLKVPPTLAQERAKQRRKGIPLALRGDTDAKVLAHFKRYDGVLKRSVQARAARGCHVLTLDGKRDEDVVTDAALDWLRAHLSAIETPATPRQKLAKR